MTSSLPELLRRAAADPEQLHWQSWAALAPGPALIVLGAVHGNEACGAHAIAHTIADLHAGRLRLARGRLTLVPVANPLAFQQGTRGGERNLNRHFVPRADPRDYEDRVTRQLAPLLAARGQAVAWLTGSQKKKERAPMLAAIESGAAALVIGTHAVIQAQVKFAHLGLAVIDEQHRFGVEQRLALRNKLSETEREPHLLMMSATPIPRTLAMSYYADLDVSTLDELPPGRTPVLTKLLAEHRRDELVERLRAQIAEGRQVYWVCPLIEESEALDLRHASQTHEELSAALPGACVGLLHARLPPADKKAVMAEFVAGRIDVLVSTTVIEVGVDVPNASVMVIEHAERFGLSQLHQLRGRVGRGAAASACVLLYSVPEGGRLGETARARLKAMLETSDGFEIARRDLAIRGPGEFLGARQSGDALLRFADLAEDGALLQWARAAAPAMWARYPEDAARHVERWLGARADYLKA